MNVTARLQANSKEFGRALLVSSDLLSLIDRSQIDDLLVEALGPTQLRERTAAIDVFSIANAKNVHELPLLDRNAPRAASTDSQS